MLLEQAIKENKEIIATGNWQFVKTCFEVAISQAIEAATSCVMCGHGRNMHSTNGCTYSGVTPRDNCTCTVRYTDKDMFR